MFDTDIICLEYFHYIFMFWKNENSVPVPARAENKLLSKIEWAVTNDLFTTKYKYVQFQKQITEDKCAKT